MAVHPAPESLAVAAHTAIADKNWQAVRLLLHPYLHWHNPDGTVLRGRTKVMAALAASPTPPAAGSVEVRDGQIYRWHAPEALRR